MGHTERHARWEGQSLLRSREHEVESPRVGLDGGSGHPGDAVYQQHHVSGIVGHGGQLFDGIERPGRGLGVYHGDGIVVLGGQGPGHLLRAVHLAPGHFESVHLETVRGGDFPESVAEGPVDQCQHPFQSTVPDGRFHETRGGRRRDIDRTFGTEQPLEPRLQIGHEFDHRLAAVADHGVQLGGKDVGVYFCRTREEKTPEGRLAFRFHRIGLCGVRCAVCGVCHPSNPSERTRLREGKLHDPIE